MSLEISYSEFCTRYYASAMELANMTIATYIKNNGSINRYIDIDLVKHIGVSFGLEKVYKKYDVDRAGAASLKTYMSVVIHNCVISELKKAWTEVKRNHPELVGVKTKDDAKRQGPMNKVGSHGNNAVKREAYSYMEASRIHERKEKIIEWMMECVKKLHPTDQVILKFWMDGESNYVERVLHFLNIESNSKSQQMVRTRCRRAKLQLQQLMGGAKPDYRDVYIPTGEFRKDALKEAVGDRNLERRRDRAIKRQMATYIDYRHMSSKLYDKLVK